MLLFSLVAAPAPGISQIETGPATEGLATLVKSYPEFLDRIEGNELLWKDGTRMRLDDGRGPKALEPMLDDPDIKDMFLMRLSARREGGAAGNRLRSRTGQISPAVQQDVWRLPERQLHGERN